MPEPTDFVGAWMVEHADVPAHLTLAQWRQQRAADQRAALQRAREARRAQRRVRVRAVLRLGRRIPRAGQRQVRHG